MKSCWRYSRMPRDSPDTAEGGAAMAATDLPPVSPGGMVMQPTAEPANGWPPQQAASSGPPAQQCISHGHIQHRVCGGWKRLSIYHRRVPLHTQRNALSSKPIERPIDPLLILTRAPYQMSLLFLQTFGSEQ